MNVGPAFFSSGTASDRTRLLLHFEDTSGFSDSSVYANSVSAVGGAATSTTRAKWGARGFTTNGTHRLDIADTTDLRFGAEQFSVEGFLYVPSAATLASDNTIACKWTTSGTTRLSWWVGLNAAGFLRFFFSTDGVTASSFATASAAAIARDQWVHWAVYRRIASGADEVYGAFDGAAFLVHATMGGAVLHANTAPVSVAGLDYTSSSWLPNDCSLDEVRICVGTIDYGSSAFTPPSAAFT